MRYQQIPKSEIAVSRIALGCWAIGGKWGPVDDNESIGAIKRAREVGVNLFDTADVYGFGHSEKILGKALKGDDEAIIATKVGLGWNRKGRIRHDLSVKYIREACEGSLKRLKREAIDLYQIHWPDPCNSLTEAAGVIENLITEGKVRYGGFSNLDATQLKTVCEFPGFISYQGSFSLFDQAVTADILPLCREISLGFFAYEPLYKGMLTGKFKTKPSFPTGDHRIYEDRFTADFTQYRDKIGQLEELATRSGLSIIEMSLSYLLNTGGVVAAVTGAKTAAQIEENVKAADCDPGLTKAIKKSINEIIAE